jgi:hypothetical protein
MSHSRRPTLLPLGRVLDHRQSMRVATSMPVSLVMTNYPAPFLPARAVDVGVAGICVQTDTLLDAGSVHSIKFSLGELEVEFPVESRWQSEPVPEQGPLTGFAFTKVDADCEIALWDLIQKRGRELASFIRSCVGFESLGFEDRFNLSMATRLRQVAAGKPVYGPEDPSATSIYALVQGSVILEELEQGGIRERLGVVKPGEPFGGLAVVAGCSAFEYAFATEESVILEFPSYTVEHLISTKPMLGIVLLRAASYQWLVRLRESAPGGDAR